MSFDSTLKDQLNPNHPRKFKLEVNKQYAILSSRVITIIEPFVIS